MGFLFGLFFCLFVCETESHSADLTLMYPDIDTGMASSSHKFACLSTHSAKMKDLPPLYYAWIKHLSFNISANMQQEFCSFVSSRTYLIELAPSASIGTLMFVFCMLYLCELALHWVTMRLTEFISHFIHIEDSLDVYISGCNVNILHYHNYFLSHLQEFSCISFR